MRIFTLLARNLTWYWRTNLAVLLGVATAAGVLGGALLVGDSVRASLRDLVLARLGNVDSVVAAQRLFPRGIGYGIQRDRPPMICARRSGHEQSGIRRGRARSTVSTSASGDFRS